MNKILTVTVASALLSFGAISASTTSAQAEPGGCLKYGLGGAVAGHFAGGHRIKGALAGCAAGIARRKYHQRQQAKAQQERLERQRQQERQYQRPRQYDDGPVARAPRREFDPSQTGSIRPREYREQPQYQAPQGGFYRQQQPQAAPGYGNIY